MSVDARVELISIIQTIGHYRDILPFLLARESFPYAREVVAHFGPFRDHPAVAMFDEVSRRPRMFNFMAPPTTMLYLTPELAPRDDIIWPDALPARIGGRDRLARFLAHLRDFAEVADFQDFFAAHGVFYEQLIAGVLPNLGAQDVVAELERFYGAHQASYNLVLVALYGHVGFGPLLDTVDATGGLSRHVYNILGPRSIVGEIPHFGDAVYFTEMQRHEFGHSFVNPLTEKHWDLVKGAAHRFDTLSEQKVCGDWEECINEYTIRAVTTHLAFADGAAAGEAALAAERARNVVWIDPLLARIREYAANRDRYPTLDDFFPRLLRTFLGT